MDELTVLWSEVRSEKIIFKGHFKPKNRDDVHNLAVGQGYELGRYLRFPGAR